MTQTLQFQSTHSLRSATFAMENREISLLVSIHALLAECDAMGRFARAGGPCFNPRTPCGVRLASSRKNVAISAFQSTHSLRSATSPSAYKCFTCHVSIHALLAECDHLPYRGTSNYHGFNPRTPCGVRLSPAGNFHNRYQFQSTHSLRSATFFIHRYYLTPAVSIHALLAECDSPEIVIRGKRQGFNPRTPCGVRRPRRP